MIDSSRFEVTFFFLIQSSYDHGLDWYTPSVCWRNFFNAGESVIATLTAFLCYVGMMLFRFEFSNYSSIDFQSVTTSFWRNMKWARKSRSPPLNRNRSNMVKHYLDKATITSCQSTLAPLKWQFKRWEVFLPYPVA